MHLYFSFCTFCRRLEAPFGWGSVSLAEQLPKTSTQAFPGLQSGKAGPGLCVLQYWCPLTGKVLSTWEVAHEALYSPLLLLWKFHPPTSTLP